MIVSILCAFAYIFEDLSALVHALFNYCEALFMKLGSEIRVSLNYVWFWIYEYLWATY